MNVGTLFKKHKELQKLSYEREEFEAYNTLSNFEALSILLKLEENKLLAPEPEIKLEVEDKIDWTPLAFELVIKNQKNKINYLTQLLKDNNIIVVEG